MHPYVESVLNTFNPATPHHLSILFAKEINYRSTLVRIMDTPCCKKNICSATTRSQYNSFLSRSKCWRHNDFCKIHPLLYGYLFALCNGLILFEAICVLSFKSLVTHTLSFTPLQHDWDRKAFVDNPGHIGAILMRVRNFKPFIV